MVHKLKTHQIIHHSEMSFMLSSSWDGLFAEEFQEIEADVKNYLGTLRRGMKESHLKVFMEQLSSNYQSFFLRNRTGF